MNVNKNFRKPAALTVAVIVLAGCAAAQVNKSAVVEQADDTPLLIRLVRSAKMSAGISPFYAGDFGGGVFGWAVYEDMAKIRKEAIRSETTPWNGGGISAFFDVTYAEINFGFTSGGGNPVSADISRENKDMRRMRLNDVDISFTSLNFGVLLKYPKELNNNLSVYSAAGIEYALLLSGSTKNNNQTRVWDGKEYAPARGYAPAKYAPKAGDFNALWLKIGAGGDYALTYRLFLRPEALYGFRLANKSERDYVEEADGPVEAVGVNNLRPALGHGVTVKLGIGIKL